VAMHYCSMADACILDMVQVPPTVACSAASNQYWVLSVRPVATPIIVNGKLIAPAAAAGSDMNVALPVTVPVVAAPAIGAVPVP
jgi:hypothetical protein